MKEQEHCTPGLCPGPTENDVIVAIAVPFNHPLLQLQRMDLLT
jgi:hypothetical protein